MIPQGTPEWWTARIGKVTASRIADLTAKTKTGFGAGRANYMAELIAERLTGTATESYTNSAMQHGTDTEPEARTAYEFHTDATVSPGGFVDHPSVPMSGASPDGFIGDDGLLEIKCPNTATHIETLSSATVPERYLKQMQWQMACATRAWCDFVSYDPRMPESMRLFVKRIEHDDAAITALEIAVAEFLTELDTKLAKLQSRYDPKPKIKRHWSELSLPEQAGIRCQDEKFQAWLRTCGWVPYSHSITNSDDAAQAIRNYCGIQSRADLGADDGAAAKWVLLNREYDDWLHSGALLGGNVSLRVPRHKI